MSLKFNIKTVLIAPLDWGLGHATRCIPIIKALLTNHYTVIVAASDKPKKILQQEFPDLLFVELNGYNISYSKNKFWLPLKILLQFPKIIFTIRYENNWLEKIIETQKIDLVISDNRFGLYNKNIFSVFITHQLTIQTPFAWLTKVVQKLNYHFINRFNQCWIPDAEGTINIAGILSHPKKLPKTPIKYLGILSRFKHNNFVENKYDYCILLSGPEPQRTILEEIILKDIGQIKGNIVLLRGLPTLSEGATTNNNLTTYNHLAGEQLNIVLAQSEWVICRSGYTSIMELLALQKTTILIPTPGQTEQLFLAKTLMQQGLCFSVQQHQFNLVEAIEKAKTFIFKTMVVKENNLEHLLPQIIKELKNTVVL